MFPSFFSCSHYFKSWSLLLEQNKKLILYDSVQPKLSEKGPSMLTYMTISDVKSVGLWPWALFVSSLLTNMQFKFITSSLCIWLAEHYVTKKFLFFHYWILTIKKLWYYKIFSIFFFYHFCMGNDTFGTSVPLCAR